MEKEESVLVKSNRISTKVNEETNLVSVIVPAYNAEKYIDRCLKSICYQSYGNLEIILVDDGSNDSTLEIAENWAKKDGRIKLISQQNRGVSAARNVGMELSNGRYITFVDSDDYLASNFVESLLPLMVSCQMAVSGTRCCSVDSRYISETLSVGNPSFFEVGPDFDINEINYSDACWGILYDASLVSTHKIRFNESYSFGEDSLFFYQVLTQCENIGIINSKLYTHTINNEGACHRPWKMQRYTGVLSAENKIDVIGKFPTTQLCERVHLIGVYLTTLIVLLESNDIDMSLATSLKKRSETHLVSLAWGVMKANFSPKSKIKLWKTIISIKKRIKVMKLWPRNYTCDIDNGRER